MISNIKGHLSQPSPYPAEIKDRILLVSALFALTFMFTYLLEPFHVYPPQHKITYTWICFFRAILVAGLASIYFFLLNPKKNWTRGYRLLVVTLFLLSIGLGNFFIRDIIYDNPNNWSFHYFFSEIYHAYVAGIVILLILIPFSQQPLWVNPLVSPPIKTKDDDGQNNRLIAIATQVKADDFHLQIDRFVLAKTEGNYTEIYTRETSGLRKELKRIPLKSLEEQLSPYNWIVKTHRAHLVNKHMVEDISGNAQGYRLSLPHYPEKVPVSRAFISAFKRAQTAE